MPTLINGKDDFLRSAAAQSGLTVEFLQALTAGLHDSALIRVLSNAVAMPSALKALDDPKGSRGVQPPVTDAT